MCTRVVGLLKGPTNLYNDMHGARAVRASGQSIIDMVYLLYKLDCLCCNWLLVKQAANWLLVKQTANWLLVKQAAYRQLVSAVSTVMIFF